MTLDEQRAALMKKYRVTVGPTLSQEELAVEVVKADLVENLAESANRAKGRVSFYGKSLGEYSLSLMMIRIDGDDWELLGSRVYGKSLDREAFLRHLFKVTLAYLQDHGFTLGNAVDTTQPGG